MGNMKKEINEIESDCNERQAAALISSTASRQQDDEGAASRAQLSRYYLGEEGLTDTMTEFLRRGLVQALLQQKLQEPLP